MLLQLLRSIAARADSEGIATLRSDELAFAMTLPGRRLLQRIRLDGNEFRLSIQAREMLALAYTSSRAVVNSPDGSASE